MFIESWVFVFYEEKISGKTDVFEWTLKHVISWFSHKYYCLDGLAVWCSPRMRETGVRFHIEAHNFFLGYYDLDNHRTSAHYLEIIDEAKPSLLFKQWTLARLIICLKSHLGQDTSNYAVWCPLWANNTTLKTIEPRCDLIVTNLTHYYIWYSQCDIWAWNTGGHASSVE